MAVVSIVTLVFTGCAPSGPKAVLQGKKLIEQGKYPQAMAKLRNATALLPTNAQAWNYYGLACHYNGRGSDAEVSYKRALALDPDLTEAHYNLACLWLAENKPEKTEAAKTELLAYTLRRGNSVEGLLKLGLAQLRTRDTSSAEKTFSDVLRLNAQSSPALNGLGLARLQRGRAEEAARYFQTALKYQADYRPALLNLAIVEQEYLKDRGLALQKYRQFAALKPPSAETAAVANQIRLLEQELNPPPRPAKPAGAPPPSTTTPSNSSAPRASQGRQANLPRNDPPTNPPQATAAVPVAAAPTPAPLNFQTVKLSPEPIVAPAQDIAQPSGPAPSPSAEPMISRPIAAASLESQTNVAKHGLLERINPFNLFRGGQDRRSSQPTPLPPASETPDPTPLGSGGETVENAGPPSNAQTARYAYQWPPRPAAGNRDEAQRYFDAGLKAQQAHNLTEAIKAYRQSTQVDPGFFDAYYNLGLAAAEAGDWPAALSAYEHALAARPESLDGRYNFALALKQAHYYLDATAELEKILTTFPNEPRANLALGNLYAQQLHQSAKARSYYVKVLDNDPQNPQANAIRYWLAANPP